MIVSLHHIWQMTECAVNKLSVAKTAVLGGASSALSFASVAAGEVIGAPPDLSTANAYLYTATLAVGLATGIAGLGLILLKASLIWRHRSKPPRL